MGEHPAIRLVVPKLSRRAALYTLVLGGGATLLAACQQQSAPASTAAPAKPTVAPTTAPAKPAASAGSPSPAASGAVPGKEWDDLVAAAKQEGRVVIYGPPGPTYRTFYADEFQKAFPDIKVDYQGANGSQQAPKLAAERQAGKFLADTYIGGASSPLRSLLPINAFDPIEPALVHPEVKDKSKWFEGRFRFLDNADKHILAFAGDASATPIVRNTTVVGPSDVTKWADLLDPRWKGKIVSGDPEVLGAASGNLTDVAADPRYGIPFLEKLFSKEHGVVLTGDARQLMDWIAQGQYPIGMGVPEFEEAQALGLPVDEQPLDVETLTTGFAHVLLVNQAPHPSAVRVFINWVLSRDGQIAYQRITKEPSLRMDIPRDTVDPKQVVIPGKQYVNSQHEQHLELRNQWVKRVKELRA